MSRSVLVLEPFCGGSHAAFWNGWKRESAHAIQLVGLPAVHWKWRSRHASFTFAQRCQQLIEAGNRFDVVVCSEMLCIPTWRGFVGTPLNELPIVAYFHENQFTYPLSDGQTRDYHYAYDNVLTAIAADEIWFNSAYHRDEFAHAAITWLKRMPDYGHLDVFQAAAQRAKIHPPGISPPAQLATAFSTERKAPHQTDATNSCTGPVDRPLNIGWVARWEHDKRPDQFVWVIERLLEKQCDFRLILLGQQFARRPPELDALLQLAGERILHCGYAASTTEYWQWLQQIDVVISTADHEFFGIGIAEAIYAGAYPLLPNRLVYPELLELMHHPNRRQHLYDSMDQLVNELLDIIQAFSARTWPHHAEQQECDVQRLTWARLAQAYDGAIETIVAARSD